MYNRIENNADAFDQNFNKLTNKFGFKSCFVREPPPFKCPMMEIYVPILYKKGIAKINARNSILNGENNSNKS